MRKTKKLIVLLASVLLCLFVLLTSISKTRNKDLLVDKSMLSHGGQPRHGQLKHGDGKLEHTMFGGGWSTAQIHVLVLRFMGQQGVGVKALVSLQCWISQIGLSAAIVEPTITSSLMTGNIISGKVTLTDLFDMDNFNTLSRGMGYPELVSRDSFFENASRNIVFVKIETKSTNLSLSEPDVGDRGGCLKATTTVLQSLVRRGFCIVKVVSANKQDLTLHSLRNILGKWAKSNITLVISLFGPWQYGKNCKNDVINHQYQPSLKVLNDAKSYKQRYLATNNPIAVMLRTEHVLQNKLNLTTCLKKTVALTRKIRPTTSGIPMVAIDFGRYGSGTWNWSVKDSAYEAGKRLTEATLPLLLGKNMSFSEWEDTFSLAMDGDSSNQGYMAAVQRAIASSARCLILVGGGHFQELVLQDHVKLYPQQTPCVHFICTDNEKQLREVIRSGSH